MTGHDGEADGTGRSAGTGESTGPAETAGLDAIPGIDDVLALVGREPVVARARGGDAAHSSPRSPNSPRPAGSDRSGAPADGPREGRRERHRAASWATARALAARAGRSARPGPTPGRVPLDQALGRALAEPLSALTDLPSFDTSAMDGWAVSGPGPWSVRSAEPPSGPAGPAGTESVDAGILAGHGRSAALADGTAVRIATGARVPPDTTAVIRSEHARVDATGHLHAGRAVTQGQDIRPRGQECRSGDRLLPAGVPVTPAVLGLAAAAGYDELLTVPRPRVEVLVLGDELLAGGIPHDGLIRDALGPMIAPWLRALGAEVIATRRLGDDAEALYGAITASEADLILSTGGTAAGPVDHVHPVLARVGAELLVDGVAVRPGHPMLLAALPSGRYLVGLPGNPLAAVSGLLTLAEPLLRALAGRAPRPPYHAPLRDAVPGHPHDTRLVPFVHHDEGLVPLRFHGPAMLRGIAAADGLAVVAPGGARSGDELEVLDLPWTASVDGGCFT
ncbi:molybdopterin molybdotransferase MoeA [Streptomyces paludis]|uniref:Molybdopterin molybdenumtransferase n=1 Tax=Streptomyces paludis TaxID=2282738 RepID=A0A345HQI4_9ACTN|nr:molybdopterin molybdotransferase MoeA [Streptomyces paludis]AXG78958.1 molybdopterin molybdenumtransferase MoeA [Streptomyces paludis]